MKAGASTAAIQSAIDSLDEKGGIVYLPSGTYAVSKTLILPAFTELRGSGNTILRASSSLDSVIMTKGFGTFAKDRKAMWHDTSGVPMDYAVTGITIDGAGIAKTGIKMYGYDFRLTDLAVKNCTETGILETWSGWNGSDTWNDNYSKFFESHVENVSVSGCRTGIDWSGLTDSYLTGITLSSCTTGLSIKSNIYPDKIKVTSCDVGVLTNSDACIGEITSSGCRTAVKIDSWHVNIESIISENSKEKDIEITSKAKHITIRSAEINTGSVSHTAIENNGQAVIIGKKIINGKTSYDSAAESKDLLAKSKTVYPLPNAEAGTVITPAAKGDLYTDDTKAIQNAIDSLRTSGGTVFLPAGTYRITKKLLLYSNVQLQGAGAKATQIYLSDDANTEMLETVPGSKGFAIKNISFFGNKYDGHNRNSAGLRIRGSGYLMDNVWVDAASGNGAEFVTENGSRAYVRNLNVKYCAGKGIVLLGTDNIYLDNLTVSECGDSGIESYCRAEIGYTHLYANHGDFQFVDEAGVNVGTMVSESAYGTAVLLKKNSDIHTLQVYANRSTDLYIDGPGVKVGVLECRNPVTVSGAVKNTAKDAAFGIRKITKTADDLSVSVEPCTYTGQEVKPILTVKCGSETLAEGKDYEASYRNNICAGTAAVKVTCKGSYEGEKEAAFTIKPKNISELTVSGITSRTYTGKAVTLNLSIKNGDAALKEGTDYNISYKDNVNIGKAVVTVSGIGNYAGTISKTFCIVPVKTSISKVTGAKSALTVKWVKKSVTGYQVQYCTKKSFSGAKAVNITSAKTVSKKITKLKRKTTYHVRVRSYKTVGKTRYYSGWSAVKSIKTK